MNNIEFVKEKIPFTQVANGVLADKRLTAKAKGLYAYLYSKPDGWVFAIDRIVLEMADGRQSVNSGLKELEKYGFLTRKRQSDGRVVYTVHFPPLTHMPKTDMGLEKPYAENPTVVKPHSGKISMISNKDIKVIKSISNKDSDRSQVALVIKAFEKVDAKNKTYYGNKTQRSCAEFLIKQYGLDNVLKVIEIVEQTNGRDYAPVITSPYDLKEKWGKLASAVQRIKNNQVVML
jgi:hypothetical protein